MVVFATVAALAVAASGAGLMKVAHGRAASLGGPGAGRPSSPAGAKLRIPVIPPSLVDSSAGGRPLGRGVYVTPRQVLAAVGPMPRGMSASVHVLHVGGLERYYVQLAPRSAAKGPGRLPVYVALHGHHMNPAQMVRATGLPSLAGPAVLVYPAGIGESWDAGGCCWFAHVHHVDDVAFLAAVVRQVLAENPGAARSKVYALGFSNGGRMAYRAACALPGTFSGMAAVEAVPVMGCRHLHPLNIEIVARSHDPLLRFGRQRRNTIDGYRGPTVTATVATWERLDGCVGLPVTRRQGTTTIMTWSRCRAGTHLQYALYAGSGHVWSWGRGVNPSASDLVLAQLGHNLRPRSGVDHHPFVHRSDHDWFFGLDAADGAVPAIRGL